MKKFVATFILIISLLSMTNGQFTKIGGGLALSSGFQFHQQTFTGNKSGIIAVSFKADYNISLPFYLSPSFTIFYPHITKDPGSKQTVSSMMFDINGHYVFNSLDKFEFYGLAGLDILFTKNKYSYVGSPSSSESDNALGLNLGLGTYMKITDKFDIYGEAKYIFNNKYNQFMLNAGVLLNIDWMKKHENTELN
jgi:opacity protein-like surface antigen